MPIESLMLIFYCFGFVLNILITVGVLGAVKHDRIVLGQFIFAAMFIALSWVGTFIVIINKLRDNLDVVVWRKK